jgi:hypothetical protein
VDKEEKTREVEERMNKREVPKKNRDGEQEMGTLTPPRTIMPVVQSLVVTHHPSFVSHYPSVVQSDRKKEKEERKGGDKKRKQDWIRDPPSRTLRRRRIARLPAAHTRRSPALLPRKRS